MVERGKEGGRGTVKGRNGCLSVIFFRLSEAVTPLLSTSYSEQLKMKEKAMSEFLKKLAKKISQKDSNPVSLTIHL